MPRPISKRQGRLLEGRLMKKSIAHSKDSGIVLFYLAALLFVLLAFSGLAVDLGRAYVVKAHLSKAVDGAALAAARVIGNGQSVAQTEANKIFNTNFPSGFLGVSSVQNPPNLNFQMAADGSNQITVSSDGCDAHDLHEGDWSAASECLQLGTGHATPGGYIFCR